MLITFYSGVVSVGAMDAIAPKFLRENVTFGITVLKNNCGY